MFRALSEKVKVCIAIETTTAEIYHHLSSNFPSASAFWHDLALSEEDHANILVMGAGYLTSGELPGYIVPDSQELIDETFRLVREAKDEIVNKQMSLTAALVLALKIEKSTAESYLQEVMRSETDSPIMARLKKLRMDELTHADKIRDFMKTAGSDAGGIN